MNASDLIEKIDQSYSQIVRLYCSVPIKALLEPSLANGWSVKDLLAHIAVWEWRCVALLEQSHETNMPLQAVPDVEALNEEIFQEHKEQDWEDVDNGFREAHRTLLNTIREFPSHRLNDPIVLQTIAEESWEHYQEHLPALKQWHQKISNNEYAAR